MYKVNISISKIYIPYPYHLSGDLRNILWGHRTFARRQTDQCWCHNILGPLFFIAPSATSPNHPSYHHSDTAAFGSSSRPCSHSKFLGFIFIPLRGCGGGDAAAGMWPSGAMLVLFCCGLDKQGCRSCFAAGDVLLREFRRCFNAGMQDMFCGGSTGDILLWCIVFASTALHSIK